MTSKFFFSLKSIKPQKNYEAGNITCITSKEVPGLVNISFENLNLNKNASVEPIWHPNANKIGYCVGGNVLVAIRTPNKVETFIVKKGEMFFIPKGYIHHIENKHEGVSSINFALNSTTPETMRLSKAVYSISDTVFNSTFNTGTHFIDGLKKTKNDDLIKILPQIKTTQTVPTQSQFKFDIESSHKAILTKGGYVQLGTKTNLPILEGLGILGFGLNPKGIVEPHWHTNAGELVYIVKGKTRITVLSPDGQMDVLEVSEGEGAFAPASHFHNIENIGPDPVEVIAFFSDSEPDYLGIGEVIGSYSNELLASVFNTPSNYFDAFKKPEKPLVIVPIT